MDQPIVSIAAQVREVVETTKEAMRVPHAEDISSSAAASSHEADALRGEIILAGRKLWERGYVDGNGGNISVRLGSKFVLCTPTMISKRDMVPDDICLSDMDGNILAGDRPRTSEMLLHLAIYKANAQARAVLHCHPPYATAFAMTGSAPPAGFISEYEIFIGPAAVAPYQTPGTQAFAESVLPYVQDHNVVLLTNHGMVCWSDTVTHAEWLAEILDTYCKTYVIAQQIGRPLHPIPEEKIREILELKRRMGLPDARMAGMPEAMKPGSTASEELEPLVEQVAARFEGRQYLRESTKRAKS
ncbi:MAG TPA: class II aldolase/adducin family protein [Terracidiphilus sp.]|jgi:L-fuculose-phosphate aldolase|nr:class II aldolase/adducin family protein [Terracidiphilus sp.]